MAGRNVELLLNAPNSGRKVAEKSSMYQGTDRKRAAGTATRNFSILGKVAVN